MKKYILFIISVLAFCATNAQGWQWLEPKPQGNSLSSIFYVMSTGTGYCVGNCGTILKTSDNGTTWATLQTITNNNLYSCYFSDVNTGYAVGEQGLIIKTSDGGSTWIPLFSSTSSSLRSVCFTDANTGYAAGDYGVLLKTYNAGASWITLPSGITSALRSLSFPASMTGYAVGDSGKILKTTDGGISWSKHVAPTSKRLFSVFFLNSLSGYAVGDSTLIFHTIDSGLTWTKQDSPMYSGWYSLYSVYFSDSQNGYAVGNTYRLKTTNGGLQWQIVNDANALAYQYNANFYSIQCIGSSQIVMCGGNGLILQSTNGGITWSAYSHNYSSLLSVQFTDKNTGYTCGYHSNKATILKTTDAGANWNFLYGPSVIWDLYWLSFPTVTTGYLAEETFGRASKTTNAGANWSTIYPPEDVFPRSVFFTDANTGYITNDMPNNPNNSIIKTTDGGATWNYLNVGTTLALHSIYFTNSNIGYAVGKAGMIKKTSDAGITWITQNSGVNNYLMSVYFTSATIGYCSGLQGTILKTTNGGNTWIQQSTGTNNDLNGIYFKDSLNGYAVGNSGTILKTKNGGTTWFKEYSGTINALSSLYFTSVDSGYIVGQGGTILKTTDGGGSTPMVVTVGPGDFNGSTVTLNGRVIANNTSTQVFFDWGLTASYGNTLVATPDIVGGILMTNVNAQLSGLSYNTTYHYSVRGVYPAGTVYGSDMSFVLPCIDPAGLITGPSNVCLGESGDVYSIPPIPNAASYSWSVPQGVTVIMGAGTNSITVSIGSSAVPGVIEVHGLNSCGNGTSSMFFVNVNPSPYPSISGDTSMCVGSGYYNYTTEVGMNSYSWNVSAGGTITYGQGTNLIMVTWNNAGSQAVSVTYTDASGCQSINPTVLNVTVNDVPAAAGSINGTDVVCAGDQSVPYNVAPITGALTYVWQLPTGATIASGEWTNTITVNYDPNTVSGPITIMGNNLCGDGAGSSLSINVNPIPLTPTITANGYLLTSDAVSGNQWYHDGIAVAGATNQGYTVPASAPGWYWTIVTLNGCVSDSSNHLYIQGVGVNEQKKPTVNIYPDPNNGHFSISFYSQKETTLQVGIYNSLGLRIFGESNYNVSGNMVIAFDLGSAPSGLYTVVLRYNDNKLLRKILVNK